MPGPKDYLKVGVYYCPLIKNKQTNHDADLKIREIREVT